MVFRLDTSLPANKLTEEQANAIAAELNGDLDDPWHYGVKQLEDEQGSWVVTAFDRNHKYIGDL